MVLITASCTRSWTSIVFQALCLLDLTLWIYLSPSLYNHKGSDLGHTWMVGFPYFLQFKYELGSKAVMHEVHHLPVWSPPCAPQGLRPEWTRSSCCGIKVKEENILGLGLLICPKQLRGPVLCASPRVARGVCWVGKTQHKPSLCPSLPEDTRTRP